MQINLTGHHLDLTDALRDFVNDKFTRLERHFDHVTQVHVILGLEKHQHKAEAKMHVPGLKGELFAHAEHTDMYSAIDGLIDKLDRQLLKHKEKLTDHHKREKASVADAAAEAEAAAASAS